MAQSGFTDATNTDLIRTQLWSADLKKLLLDDLFAMQFVKTITDFPDGSLINIPIIGQSETSDFVEGQSVKYNKMDTGNYQFQFDQYKYSANSISEKFKRDSFYSSDVISAFVPNQHRALMQDVEARVLSRGPGGQTASDLNVINTVPHRWVTAGSGQVITPQDFSKAKAALHKANVPLTNLVAVLDASTIYTLETQTNLVNALSPYPMYEDILKNGLVTGFKFRYNIFGFDCYVSNYLPTGISETIDSVSVTSGVANQFFSAAPGDTQPIIGGFRQMPQVYTKFDMDKQETDYLTITEYGFQLYRPENMVVVLTSTDVY